MYTLDDLQYTIDNIPKHITGCMKCQDIVTASLINKWKPDLFKEYDSCDLVNYYSKLNSADYFYITKSNVRRDYFDPNSKNGVSTYQDKFTIDEIIPFIQNKLTQFILVSMDIALIPFNYKNPQHSFVLVKIDTEFYIIDAYAKTRSCEYRRFNLESFFELIKDPNNIELWNQLFKCKEILDVPYYKTFLTIRC
jgi:hypothetical protein